MPSNASRTVATRNQSSDLAIPEQLNARIAELVKNAPVDTGQDGLARLLLRLATAETIEDAAAIFEKMDNSVTVTGIPLMVTGFVLRESKYHTDEATGVRLPFYATVFATVRESGEEINFNCGASSVVMTLLVANQRGIDNPDRPWFPFTAHIEGKELENGFTARNLVFDK